MQTIASSRHNIKKSLSTPQNKNTQTSLNKPTETINPKRLHEPSVLLALSQQAALLSAIRPDLSIYVCSPARSTQPQQTEYGIHYCMLVTTRLAG